MSSSTETVFDMIVDAAKFNPKTEITFADPKVNPKTSGKSVGILGKNKNSLKLRFPLALTWGAQKYVDPSSNRESYSMAIQFPGEGYRTPQTDKWLENMSAMEEVVLTHVMTNWKKIFNKPPPSREVADALYTRAIKYSKDPNTGEVNTTKAPTMKIKLGYWENKFDCEIYSPDGKMLYSQATNPLDSPLDLIPKASQTAVIVQCGGVWFAGGKFGVTWKLIQAVVKPKPTLKGRCLISLSNEDQSVISSQQIPVEDDEDAGTSVGMEIVNDTDDETEPVSAPPPKPVPAPVAAPAPAPAPAPVVQEQATPAAPKKKLIKRPAKGGDE